MLDGLFDILGSLFPDATVVGDCQVVLDLSPIYREVLWRVDLQSLFVVLDGSLDVIS